MKQLSFCSSMVRVFDTYWHSDLNQYYFLPCFYLIGFIVTHLDL
jgi:hypothetical protein